MIASWPDLRDPVPLSIEAEFGFSDARNAVRTYPGKRVSSEVPPVLWSKLELEPDKRVFLGGSGYRGVTGSQDPLTTARALGLRDWFVAGYGPSRLLPRFGKTARQSEPALDRLRPLFGEELIGTGFIELLGEDLGRLFATVLQSVFIAGGLLPHVTALELRGRGGVRSTRDLVEAQRFEMDVLDAQGAPIRSRRAGSRTGTSR